MVNDMQHPASALVLSPLPAYDPGPPLLAVTTALCTTASVVDIIYVVLQLPEPMATKLLTH